MDRHAIAGVPGMSLSLGNMACTCCGCEICSDGFTGDLQMNQSSVTGDICLDGCDDLNVNQVIPFVGITALPGTIITPALTGVTTGCTWQGGSIATCVQTQVCDDCESNGCTFDCSGEPCGSDDDCRGANCPTTNDPNCDTCEGQGCTVACGGEGGAECSCVYDPLDDRDECSCPNCVCTYNCFDDLTAELTYTAWLYTADDGMGNPIACLYVLATLEGTQWHGEQLFSGETITCDDLDGTEPRSISMNTVAGGNGTLCSLPDPFTLDVMAV